MSAFRQHFGCQFAKLHKAGGSYRLTADDRGIFQAEVRIGDAVGTAAGKPEAKAITVALARALGIEVNANDL